DRGHQAAVTQTEQVAFQNSLGEQLGEKVEGAEGPVERQDEEPARAKYAVGFADAADGVRRMVQHTVRVDDVKTLRGELEVGRVAQLQLDREAANGKVLRRESVVLLRDIDSEHLRAGLGECDQVTADAVTDLQQSLAPRAGERDDPQHPLVTLVA